MSEQPPDRVRVTGPPRRLPHRLPVPRRRQIDQETRLGQIYMGSLLREQLRLAAVVLTALVVGVGIWPLLFHLAPALSTLRPLGIPVPWLLLGVGVYPYLVLLGWLYVRAAERNERDFTDLLEAEE